MDNEIKLKNKFLDKMKDKAEKKGEAIPKAKEIRVEGLADNLNSFPGRIRMAGPVGETSARKDVNSMNGLQAENGKSMAGSDKGKKGDSNKYDIEELKGED